MAQAFLFMPPSDGQKNAIILDFPLSLKMYWFMYCDLFQAPTMELGYESITIHSFQKF